MVCRSLQGVLLDAATCEQGLCSSGDFMCVVKEFRPGK